MAHHVTLFLVVTMDPTARYSAGRGYINHPDHIAAAEATLCAVFPLARDRLTFPDLAKKSFIVSSNGRIHNKMLMVINEAPRPRPPRIVADRAQDEKL